MPTETLTIPVAGKTARIYRITITESFSAEETGSGYSIHQWGEDTDRIKGYDEVTNRVVEFADGVHAYLTTIHGVGFVAPDGHRIFSEELINNTNGRVLDRRFGTTRPIATDDEPLEGLTELNETLTERYGY